MIDFDRERNCEQRVPKRFKFNFFKRYRLTNPIEHFSFNGLLFLNLFVVAGTLLPSIPMNHEFGTIVGQGFRDLSIFRRWHQRFKGDLRSSSVIESRFWIFYFSRDPEENKILKFSFGADFSVISRHELMRDALINIFSLFSIFFFRGPIERRYLIMYKSYFLYRVIKALILKNAVRGGSSLVSFNDNNWDSLFYYFVASECDLHLIQNGYRTGYADSSHGDWFLWCDYFYPIALNQALAMPFLHTKEIRDWPERHRKFNAAKSDGEFKVGVVGCFVYRESAWFNVEMYRQMLFATLSICSEFGWNWVYIPRHDFREDVAFSEILLKVGMEARFPKGFASNYDVIESCHVIVGHRSTLLLESFLGGKPTLIYGDLPGFRYCISGIPNCFVKNSYEELREDLLSNFEKFISTSQ